RWGPPGESSRATLASPMQCWIFKPHRYPGRPPYQERLDIGVHIIKELCLDQEDKMDASNSRSERSVDIVEPRSIHSVHSCTMQISASRPLSVIAPRSLIWSPAAIHRAEIRQAGQSFFRSTIAKQI